MAVSGGTVLQFAPRRERYNIRYCEEISYYRGAEKVTEYPGCPVIFLDSVNQLPIAANTLATRGKTALRDYLRSVIKWPEPGTPEAAALSGAVCESIQYWQEEMYCGFDPSEMDEDGPRFSEADRLIVGWLTSGTLPEAEDMIFELAWPFALRQATETAELLFHGAFEKKAESEEIASHRAKRWMDAVQPFRAASWLSRPGLFEAYTKWCLADGSMPGKPADFYKSLEELGCRPSKRRGDNGFLAPCRDSAQ